MTGTAMGPTRLPSSFEIAASSSASHNLLKPELSYGIVTTEECSGLYSSLASKSTDWRETSDDQTYTHAVSQSVDYGMNQTNNLVHLWSHIPAENRELIRQIEEISQLPDNWDGDGGSAPISTALDDAILFAERWPTGGRIFPELELNYDGKVTFQFYDEVTSLGGIDFCSNNIAAVVLLKNTDIILAKEIDMKDDFEIRETTSQIIEML